jgi:hypothetical protein
MLCFGYLWGQDPWQPLDLTGEESKVLVTEPLFSLQAGVLLGLKQPEALTKDGVRFQETLNDPVVFEKLFETLGGEFYLGTLDGEPVSAIELKGRLLPLPGIAGGVRVGPSFELQTGIHLFTAEWKGNFPITVYPSDGSSPVQHEAELFQSAKGTLLNASLKAFLMSNRFRPYIEAGGRAQLVGKHKAELRVNGGEVAFNQEALDHEFSPFGAFGLRADIYKRFYGDVVLSYGKLPGAKWTPALGFNFGFRL